MTQETTVSFSLTRWPSDGVSLFSAVSSPKDRWLKIYVSQQLFSTVVHKMDCLINREWVGAVPQSAACCGFRWFQRFCGLWPFLCGSKIPSPKVWKKTLPLQQSSMAIENSLKKWCSRTCTSRRLPMAILLITGGFFVLLRICLHASLGSLFL